MKKISNYVCTILLHEFCLCCSSCRKVDNFFTIAPAALNLLATSTSVDAYSKTFLPLETCHEKGKEDQLDKLRLEIQHQKLVSEYVLGQVNKYARWSASSTKALHHLQSPRLLEPTSLQLAIPSKSLKNYNKLLEVFCPFHYSSQETTGKPSTEPQSGNQSQSQSHSSDTDHLTLFLLNTRLVEIENL